MTRGATLLIVLAAAPHAAAQPRAAAAGERILHEYVPPPGEQAAWSWVREGRLPDQLRFGDDVLPAPRAARRATPGEQVLGPEEAMDRTTTVRPDRTTTHDGVLRYAATFNPSVVPFKRMLAFDAVHEGYVLAIADRRARPLRLARRPTPPDRTPFWGSLALRVRKGVAVPIPSVAPGAEILTFTADPPVSVGFGRDSADNLSLTADHDGTLRLVFVTDAPRSYFSAEIPPLVTVRQVPPQLRPTLAPTIQRAAARVQEHIGVRRGEPLRRQLERLVAYFRNFSPAPLARDSGDTYLDIALSQRGVCRHRSWAFVITAQALGLPARYVQNEAHAFTEVFVPQLGWVRIDLGGASTELRVSNAQEKALHDAGPDPFPRPSRFARSYSQLERRVHGLLSRRRVRATGQRTAGGAISLERFRRGQPGAGQAPAGTPGRAAAPTAAAAARAEDRAEDRAAARAEDRAEDREPAAPARAATQISLSCARDFVQRGEAVRVWGRVTRGPASAAPNLRVELYLSRHGRTAEALLGTTASDAQGRFDVEVAVPYDVPVGRYRVFAATPGDEQHLPSINP